jgi:hypothetical protein
VEIDSAPENVQEFYPEVGDDGRTPALTKNKRKEGERCELAGLPLAGPREPVCCAHDHSC